MLIKDIEVIRQDLGNVRGMQTRPFEAEFLEEYFDRRGSFNTPLANSAGERYLQELADYMTCALLPIDGSWIQLQKIGDEAEQKQTQKQEEMLKYLRATLAKSNFYLKMKEVITQGLIYNLGVASVDYTGGLTFDVCDETETWVTDEIDEYSNRSYCRKRMSLSSVFALYAEDSIPEHIRDEYEDCKKTGMDRDITVITALLPNTEPYVKPSGKYKFIQVDFIEESTLFELKNKTGNTVGFTHFPLCRFKAEGKYSLANRALSDAMMVNKYEQMMYDQGELVTYPPMGVPKEVLASGSYDLGPRGTTPLDSRGQAPAPIATTATLNISEATIAKREQALREIFKIDLITRAKIVNVSQAEYHQNQYNIMKSIQPLASTLVYRTITALSARMHKLLLDNDPKYKKLASEAEQLKLDNVSFDHLGALMKKAQFMSNVGRLGQAAQFYAQLDPEAGATIDSARVLREAATTLGIPQILKSDSEVQAEQQAKADALQEQQAMEAANQGGANVGTGQAGPTGPGPAGPGA